MADIYFDLNTAIAEAPVNVVPLVDDTDFKSVELSVTASAAGMDLAWNFVTTGGAYTQTAVVPTTGGTYDWVNQGNGMYSIEIPASSGASINNDTAGHGWFSGVITGILPFRGPTIGFRAVETNNALIDGDLLNSDDVGLMYKSTVSSATSQTVFVMATDIVSSAQLVGKTVSCKDATAAQSDSRYVTAVDTSAEKITINAAFPFTVAAGDTFRVFAYEHPSYSLSAYGAGTAASQTTILARLPSALSSAGNMVADVRAMNDVPVIGAGTSADLWRA